MRNTRTLITLLSVLCVTAPAWAVEDRHQSYVSWEEGGASIVQAFDSRRLDAQRNMPVYAGDELETTRRGRLEISLADGNVVAIDRSSRIRVEQVAFAYEGERDEESVIGLDYGQVILHRPDNTSYGPVRIDSSVASYAGSIDSIYSVETGGRGRETVSVFSGTVEVRTRSGRERLREGEQASVDQDGVYGTNVVIRGGTSEFERWYLERASRFGRSSSRYLPERFASYESELDQYGGWVYLNSFGTYGWRPRGVGASWRPYHTGHWSWSPSGAFWVSSEPWGWLPYHYGRWTYAGAHGWVWLPASSYSPAWVYWVYGPSYVGWVPAGYYDCYPNYWNWRYQPHYARGLDVGFGFYGRVSMRNVNLEGWTLVDSNTFYSKRADQASLTIDAVRNRLSRDGDSATFSSVSARFDRSERADPTKAVERIARVGLDRNPGTGRDGSGSMADLTSFVRRDPELSPDLRKQVSRLRGGGESASGGSTTVISRGDDMARPRGLARPGTTVTSPAVERGAGITRPGVVTRPAPATEGTRSGITRGTTPATGVRSGVNRGTAGTPAETPARRRIVIRGETPASPPGGSTSEGTPREGIRRAPPASQETPATPSRVRTAPAPRAEDNWRRPTVEHGSSSGITRERAPSTEAPSATRGRDQTPRRVIDSIRGNDRREVRRPAATAPRSQGVTRSTAPPPRSTTSQPSTRQPSTRQPATSRPSTGAVRVAPRPSASRPPARSSAPSASAPSRPAPAPRASSSSDSSSRSTNMKRPD